MQIWSEDAGDAGGAGKKSKPVNGTPPSNLMKYRLASESQRKLSQAERQLKIKEQAELYRTRLKKVPWYTEIMKFGRSPLKYNDNWIGWYDVVMLLLLIYVALVAPFQVAFVQDPTFDVFFIIDRFVDVFFLFDLCFNFIRPQSPGNPARNIMLIRAEYLKPIGARIFPSQFGWDFISTIPYDMISPIIEKNLEGSGFGHLKVIRMIRLMRLIKIAKIIRRNSLFEFYEDKLTISYASLEMAKLTIVLVATCHWMACIWAMVPMNLSTKYDCDEEPDEYHCGHDDGLMDGEVYSWVTALAASKGRSYSHNFDVYLASLHFAVMTLTTVGYGDVAPQTPTEYVVCILLMLFSGIMWAYILGSLTAILSSMDPHGTYFKQTMDDVNYMLKQQHVDDKTASEVRRYWRKTQSVNRLKEYKDLVCMMSPKLQGELEHQIGQDLFDAIPCIQITGMAFVMELCQLTTLCKLLYPPGETILHRPELHGGSEFVPLGRCLCVVMNPGLVGYGGRVAGHGCKRKYWGEDFLLDNPHLRNEVPACALSFVEVQFIPIEAVDTLLDNPRFVDDAAALRRFKVVLATKRGLVAYAHLYKRTVEAIMKKHGKDAELPNVVSLRIQTSKSTAVSHWRKFHDDAHTRHADTDPVDKREFALTAFGKASAKGGGRSTKRATSMNMASSVLKSANRSRSPDLPIPSRLAADVDPATTPATLPPADVAAITEGLQAITTQLGAMSAWQQEADKKLDMLMGLSVGTPHAAKRSLPPLGVDMMGKSSRQATIDQWEGELTGATEKPQAKGTPLSSTRDLAPGMAEVKSSAASLSGLGRALSKSNGDLSHLMGQRPNLSRDSSLKSIGSKESKRVAVAEAKVPL